MNWTLWILASAVFLALYDLAKKASVRDNAVLPTLLFSTLFGGAAYIVALAAGPGLTSALSANGRVITLGLSKSVLVAASWIFTFKALQTLPITIATPIRASAPAVVFLVALFAYGEIPTLLQAIGMAAVFAGYFAFSWAGKHEGLDFWHNHAVWCAFAGMVLSACSALWDKYVFQIAQAPVETIQLWFQVGLVGVYLTLLVLQRVFRLKRDNWQWRWTIPLVGILLAFADWLYFRGLAIPGVPISVGSLLRRVSVVITFLLGARLFRETNLLRKGLALAAVLVGAALLCLAR